MAIESIATAAVAKEAIAAKAAEIAQQQLGQKMAMESIENHQLLQTMEQTNLANKFRIGELSAPEVDKKDVLKVKEQEAIEEDQKLQEEFSDPEKYVESIEKDELPVGEDKEEIPEEELKNLNPPSDEEPNYDSNTDESVEVVAEEEIASGEVDESTVEADLTKTE